MAYSWCLRASLQEAEQRIVLRIADRQDAQAVDLHDAGGVEEEDHELSVLGCRRLELEAELAPLAVGPLEVDRWSLGNVQLLVAVRRDPGIGLLLVAVVVT